MPDNPDTFGGAAAPAATPAPATATTGAAQTAPTGTTPGATAPASGDSQAPAAQAANPAFNYLANAAASQAAAFDENILGNFHNVAYHLKFMLTGETDNQLSAATGNAVVIAESGVTGFNIREFRLKTRWGVTGVQRNTIGLEYTLVITEALGTSLMDALLAAGGKLGVKNWAKSGFLIEITFKGYNEDGSLNPNLCINYPNQGRWLYKLNFGKIEVKLDATGGTYTLTGRSTHLTFLEPDLLYTRKLIKVEAKTLGEYMQQLGQKLTDQSNSGGGKTTYKIVLHPTDSKSQELQDPNKFTFGRPEDAGKNSQRNDSMKDQKKDTPVGNHGPQSILDMILAVIGSTDQAHRLTLDADGTVTLEKPEGDGSYRQAGVFRIYPEVKQQGYNTDKQDYDYEVTLHVRMYRVENTYLSGKDFLNPANSQKAIQNIRNRQGISKRYEYIFTGLNTEITTLDLKFELSGIAWLPANQGAFSYPESYQTHAKANPKARKQEEEVQKEVAQAQGAGSQSPTSVQPVQNPQATATPAAAGGVAVTAQQAIYAEDLLEAAAAANPLPVSTGQSANTGRYAAGSGLTAPWHRGKSWFGAIMAQAEQKALNNLTMEIKGDPYWLGLNYEAMLQSSTGAQGQSKPPAEGSAGTNRPIGGMAGGVLPNMLVGDVCFVLYFRYPYNWGETGDYQFRDNDIFNGLYAAKEIEHSFAGGVFKQTIYAMRVDLVSPKDAIQLAGSQANPTSATPAATPAAGAATGTPAPATTAGGAPAAASPEANPVPVNNNGSTGATAPTPAPAAPTPNIG